MRPFGVSAIIGTWDDNLGPQIHMVEPSGVSFVGILVLLFNIYYPIIFKGYYGTAVGKAKQAAKGEIEKLKLSELTARQAVFEVAKM